MANISLEQLDQMFEDMRNKSGWNTEGDLLWSYFFTDRNPKKLEPLAAHLVGLGYDFVSIYETDDRSTHFLHVERVERHTPESLFGHTTKMNELGEQFSIDSYDGMDVGLPPKEPN